MLIRQEVEAVLACGTPEEKPARECISELPLLVIEEVHCTMFYVELLCIGPPTARLGFRRG